MKPEPASLLKLGTISSIDPSKLSDSTVTSMLSHIRTLQRNNVALDFESLTENTVALLDRLKDTHGKPLSTAYKRQIAMTIKRLHPTATINIKPFSKHEQRATTRLMSGEFVRVIGELVNRATTIIKSMYADELKDLAIYDTCLAILLTVSTSLRVQEIHDLRLIHIAKIREDRPVSIRSKGYKNLRHIALNSLLDNLFVAIEHQRPKVENLIRKDIQIRSNAKHRARFDGGYILITSVDFMRKKLRELSSGIEGLDVTQSFGFNIFRKYITTILTENGGHKIAQTMNNHSSESTTINHYNVVSRVGAQKSYDKLFAMMDDAERLSRNPRAAGGSDTTKRKGIVVADDDNGEANAATTESSHGDPRKRKFRPSRDYVFPDTPAQQPTDVNMLE